MMRAKMKIGTIATAGEGIVNVIMNAVFSRVDQDGNSEDNTFARYTPCAELIMQVANPALVASLKEWQTFYVDFSEIADESTAAGEVVQDAAPATNNTVAESDAQLATADKPVEAADITGQS